MCPPKRGYLVATYVVGCARRNPARLRVVDMLEDGIHWMQMKSQLFEAGYTREALEIMAKRSIINSYDIGPGLKLELADDIRRLREGVYFTNER